MNKLYVVPDGGLANRMRVIAGSIVVAEMTCRRLVIVWNRRKLCNADYDDLFEPSFINRHIVRPDKLSFSLRYEIPRKRNLYTSAIYQRVRFRKTYLDGINIEPYSGNGDKLIDEINRLGDGDIMIFSGLHFCDYPLEIYREIFTPSEAVEQRIAEILNGQKPSVACQIRRTDHTEAIKYSPLSEFIDTMDQWMSDHPGEKFFLATDDQTIKAEFHHRYGRSVIFNPDRARRDTVGGIIDGYAEMMIMARCPLIYGSVWSSYCEAAAEMGGGRLIRVGTLPG
ncbi:MAG: hypothetical protein NC342_06240 [Pseudoflavonifractor sp.]|nr:hypothetical protein [Alloprevotella sp.]MCM1117117.1 hypothetical protein [Pseudoflavonifractor sp.]